MNQAADADIVSEVTDFARTCVATRPDLHQQKNFPPDLWQDMAARNLLGLLIPAEYGGRGCSYATLAAGVTALVEHGGNQGVAMTWLAHNMNAALHLVSAGAADQKQQWLPGIACGENSLTVAISEPGIGAHPKHLKTRAVRDGDDYVLNGEKSYLTNGPLAKLFLVLAISDESNGRKAFSAYLIPRDTQGFEQTPGIEIDFLHPSPHCGIKLTDCRIPAANRLGPEGTAFELISKVMRTTEDALSTAASVGAVRFLLAQLAAAAGQQDLARDKYAGLGQLAHQTETLAVLSASLVSKLDAPDEQDNQQQLIPLIAGFRDFLRHLRADLDTFVSENDLELSDAYTVAHRDMVKSSGIAARVWQTHAHRRGAELLTQHLQDPLSGSG